jgi:AcrR family transcriptional regulator
MLHVSVNDMNSPVATGRYHSPLRASQAAATRERILNACVAVLQRDGELTYAAVAAEAEVQERTVYRHFPTKHDLESAFWRRVGLTSFDADDEARLVADMRQSFAGFDDTAAVVEAMLFSRQGMQIRLSHNEQRQAMFERCLADATAGLDEETRRRAAAVTQVLYSASTWQVLRYFWDMDATESADTVEMAITLLFDGLRHLPRPIEATKQPGK